LFRTLRSLKFHIPSRFIPEAVFGARVRVDLSELAPLPYREAYSYLCDVASSLALLRVRPLAPRREPAQRAAHQRWALQAD
jgi:hypothetical protein